MPQNDAQAVEWYRKVAEQGDMWGQYHLGMMYKDGKGVGKDKDTARFWLQKAADQGHAVAKKELAKKWWWPF